MPTLNSEIEKPTESGEKLQAENDELRLRLLEAEETIAAIRSGAVDALVIEEPGGHRIYTLESADRPYRLFVEEMQQGAATLHPDGTIAWCNRQLAEMLKTQPEKLIGAALHDFVSPESRVVYDNLLWQGKTHSGRGQAQLRRTDGGLVPAYVTFNALPKDCGAAIGVLVTDLTSQRHHEQLTTAHAALRESEKQLEVELAATRQLQSVSALLIESDNPEALYQRIVDAAVAILGSDFASLQRLFPERNAGQGELLLLAHHGFAPESMETFRWVRTDTGCTCGETLRTGARTIASDVEQAPYIAGRPGLQAYRQSNIRAVQTTPLVSRTGGRILGMISTHWRKPHTPTESDLRKLDVLARQAADLLERNEAELVLRESERRFREMIDALPVAIYTTDAEGRLTHFNPAAVEFSGHTPTLGSDQWCVSFKLYHADGTPMAHDECPMAIALKEGRVIRGAEAIAERPDGKRVWFTPYPTPLRDSTGRTVGGINMLVDITERKQAEQALARQAGMLRLSFDAIVVWKLDGAIVSWSQGAQDLYGYTESEAIGRVTHELFQTVHPVPLSKILEDMQQGRPWEGELRHRTKDGREVIVSSRHQLVPGADGDGYVLEVNRDITERKWVEQALRLSEQDLRDFFDNASVGLHWVGPDGIILRVNQTELDLLGYQREEYVGRHIGEFYVDAEVISGILRRLSAGETLYEHPARLRCKDGSIKDVIINSNVLWEQGKFIHTRCFTRDVTDRTKAEEALRESEERFRLMADAVPVLIWVSDTTKGCTWFNQCWKDFSGRPMEELLGDGWARDVHPDDLDRCMDNYSTHFDARQPFSMEYRLKRHDGEYRWVLDNGIPRFEGSGEFAGYIGACSDFTERKQAEDARARLAAIVNSSEDAIVSKDLNGVITTWNRGAEQLFGYTAQEAVGQPVTMLIPPDHLNEEPSILGRIRNGEAINHYETVRHRKDGTLFDISLTVSPIKNERGQVIGASKIARDISHRKRNEEALRRAQLLITDRAAQLEQAVAERTAELTATNKQLEAFAYSVAHDLRAPVRSMEGFSAMLLEEAGASLSRTGQDFANRINRAAQFMDSLLMDLLTFSSTTQQRIELTPVNLEMAFQSVLSRLEKEIQETNARVENPGPWPTVLAHEATLGQALFNLVSNALKFVSADAPPVVQLRAEQVSPSPESGSERSPGRRVRVWVEDKGIGIAPDHQEQIFRLFTRLHGERYPGTGVGLAIVQKGIERMGGRVGVESAPAQGSRFWFELRGA